MNKRLIYSVIIIFSIITLPWWVYIPILFVGVIIFPYFIEAIIYAFIIDAAYGLNPSSHSLLNFPIALVVSLLIILLLPLRKHIRIHG